MLNQRELKLYLQNLSLKPAANEYIQNVRESPPSRRVGQFATTNVCSWNVSRKMQLTISTESRSAEKAFFLFSEYNDQVIEIWDQPEPLHVLRHTKKGIPRNGSYHPDFMILESNGVFLYEIKTIEELESLVVSNSKDWTINDDGDFIFLPAVTACQKIGINFRVFPYTTSMGIKARNINTLLKVREISPDLPLTNEIESAFSGSCVLSLTDLRKQLKEDDYLKIIACIDKGVLFGDLDSQFLTNNDEFVVALTKEMLIFAEREFLPKQTAVDGQTIPSHDAASSALKKLAEIKSGNQGRSIRRWKQQIRKGKKLGMTEFQSLLQHYDKSGNRTARINSVVEKFLTNFLIAEKDKLAGNIHGLFIDYIEGARNEHPEYNNVSEVTFRDRVAKLPKDDVAQAYGGKRAANAAQSPSSVESRIIKAQVPWECAAIDHCLCKVYLVVFEDSWFKYVARPWLTILVDNFRKRSLSFSLSFKNPSRISNARAIRDCVRRYGQLPAEIICDRGADFKSVYFESLLAHHSVTYSLRPTAHSRYGSEVEGYFNIFKELWLSKRPGYVTNKNVHRCIDTDKKPENYAVLSIEQFSQELNAFNNWYVNAPQKNSSRSCISEVIEKTKEFPFIPRKVIYNNEFLVATAVDTNNYTIDLARGISVNNQWYWSPIIKRTQGKKSKVSVRIDCENPHIIYAYIEHSWEPCYSSKYHEYVNKSESRRLSESLLILDSDSLISKLRLEAEVDLSALRKEFDLQSQGDGVSNKLSQTKHEISIFDNIRNSPRAEIKISKWEDQ